MTARELDHDLPLRESPSSGARGPRYGVASRGRALHAVGLALLHAFAFFVAAPALLASAGSGGDPFSPSPRTLALFVVVAAVDAALLIGVGLVWFGGCSLASLGWRFSHLGLSLSRGMLGFLGCVGVAASLWMLAGPGRDLSGFVAAAAAPRMDARVLFALIGIHAAFVEETIFRGYLQPTLISRWGRWGGLLGTAAIFALYHLNPRPFALLSKLAFGLVFSALRERDDSVVASAIAHALLWCVVGAL